MILCSSGAFFHRGEDGSLFVPEGSHVDAVATYGRLLTVEGLEVLITRQMVDDLAEAAEKLARTELRFPVVHAPKRLGAALPSDEAVTQLEESAWFACRIGASVLVLHLWDLPEGDRRFHERLEALALALDVVADYHIALAVETIPCLEATPLRNIERVLEHDPRACVALDTEFLALHGEVEAALAADWPWRDGRVRHVHIKDFADGLLDAGGTRRYRLPGDGMIDFVEVFDTLQRRDFSGTVSLEATVFHLSDHGEDPVTRCASGESRSMRKRLPQAH